MRSPLAVAGRALPQGWIDLLRQLALFGGAYWLYGNVQSLRPVRQSSAQIRLVVPAT